MALYFFHLVESSELHSDAFGIELADIEEAREQAKSLLPDVVRDAPSESDLTVVACQVRDSLGSVVYVCRLTLEGRMPPHHGA